MRLCVWDCLDLLHQGCVAGWPFVEIWDEEYRFCQDCVRKGSGQWPFDWLCWLLSVRHRPCFVLQRQLLSRGVVLIMSGDQRVTAMCLQAA